MRDDILLPDSPLDYRAPSLPNDNAGVERNLDAKVYGLSNLRQSQRIVSHVEISGPQMNQIDNEVRPNKMHEIIGKGKGERQGG